MLSVANRTTWENIFNSTDDLYDCNVKIYDKDDNLLLDKVHIASFSIVSRNSFVCDQIPTDECQVKLVDYANISSSIKTYLTTHQNDRTYYLKLKYVVNGIETTGFKYLVVKSFKIQRLQKEAIFNLASPLSCLSERAVNFELGYFTTGKSVAWGCRGAKYELTRAELFPVRCLQERKGIKYTFGSNTQDTEFEYKEMTISTNDGNYSGINIYDDYEINSDNPDKSSINIYGSGNGGNLDNVVVNFTAASGSAGLPDPVELTESRYVRGYTVQTSGGGTWTSKYRVRIDNDRIRLVYYPNESRPSDGTSMIWTLQLGTLSSRNPTDNSVAYVQNDGVPTMGSSDDLCLKYVRTYYGNTNIISFECRIDPTLEPLDLINLTVDDNNYRVALEEITVNFNGGFNGTVKGRIMEMVSSIAFGVQPPTDFICGNVWEFGGTVIGTFYDGTTKDITSECTFRGAPYNPSSYYFATIEVHYIQKGVDLSLTYHATYYEINAPQITINSMSSSGLNITVKRPSGDSVQNHATLYFKTSDGTIVEVSSYYHKSTETFDFSSSSNPDIWNAIKNDVIDYLNSNLEHNFVCYFGVNSGNKTADTTILAANYVAFKKPVISNLVLPSTDEHDPYGWSFRIYNNNDYAVQVHIKDSGDEITETIQANSYKTFTNNDYYEFNASFNAYITGDLEDDMYCWFVHNGSSTQNTIILEANY